MFAAGFLAIVAAATAAWAHDCPPVVANPSMVVRDGIPAGTEEVHGGYNMYITKPPTGTNTTKALLYLTDVFGIQLRQNKLLADSFARAGFLTVAPDLFNGTPAPGDINVPGFNTTSFLTKHDTAQTDPIVREALTYIRSLGFTRIGATGYCFGGRYAFRAGGILGGEASDAPAKAIFAAHPSLLTDIEIAEIRGPTSVAAAEMDPLMSVARRTVIMSLLQGTGREYSFVLYGGTSHGFGVRVDTSDPRQTFAKEDAFLQAVRWFNVWL